MRLHESSLAPNRIFGAACNFLSEFQQKNPINTVLPSSKLVRWRPSSSEMYITNLDSAIFVDTDEAGLSLVVRDASGDVIDAMSKKIPCPYSVEVLEVLVVRRAFQFIMELGSHKPFLKETLRWFARC